MHPIAPVRYFVPYGTRLPKLGHARRGLASFVAPRFVSPRRALSRPTAPGCTTDPPRCGRILGLRPNPSLIPGRRSRRKYIYVPRTLLQRPVAPRTLRVHAGEQGGGISPQAYLCDYIYQSVCRRHIYQPDARPRRHIDRRSALDAGGLRPPRPRVGSRAAPLAGEGPAPELLLAAPFAEGAPTPEQADSCESLARPGSLAAPFGALLRRIASYCALLRFIAIYCDCCD